MRRALIVSIALLATAPAVAQAPRETVPLPAGYQPEGIATLDADEVLVGSIPTGRLARVNVLTGETAVVADAWPGRAAIGVKVEGRRAYVAGGPTGKVRIHHALNGQVLREEKLGPDGATFVNDVALGKDFAFFTDSRQPRIYVLPKDRRRPPSSITVRGDFVQGPGNNLNGIVAAGRHLVAVQSSTGTLWRIDTRGGEARRIDIGGAVMTNGDGLLLERGLLSVVQNRLNQITQIRLSDDLLTGTVTATLKDPDFKVPTTIARVQGRLYAVNARFGTPATPETAYDVVRVDGS